MVVPPAHLEDRTSEAMLLTAPRPLIFHIEIFVESWSECHIVKLCPQFLSFFID